MNLYKVSLRCGNSPVGTQYGDSYVVAEDSEKAYTKVKTFLDEKDIGFTKERVLRSVTLLAEATDHPECRTILFL